MQAYQPKVGDYVEVNMIMRVTNLRMNSYTGIVEASGEVRVSKDKETAVQYVPVVCVAPFEPEKDSAMNDEVQSMGMEGL